MAIKTVFRLSTSLFTGVALTTLVLLLLAVGASRANTIDVPAGQSIQAAIHLAVPGDTIRVQAGVFTESLVITESLTLEGGYDAAFTSRIPRTTILDAQGADRVVAIGGDDLQVALDGFEITGGSTAGDGGGVYAVIDNGGRLVLHDNLIQGNQANNGGGVYAYLPARGRLQISAGDFYSNSVAGSGGGLWANLVISGSLELVDNIFDANLASSGYGGGMWVDLDHFATFQIDSNTFYSNTAAFAGGFYTAIEDHSHGSFEHNQALNNHALDAFGGGWLDLRGNVWAAIDVNRFSANRSQNYAGGLYLQVDDHSRAVGDSLWLQDNTVIAGSAGGADISIRDGSAFTLTQGLTVTGNTSWDSIGGLFLYAAYSRAYLPGSYFYDNHALGDDAGAFRFSTGDAGSQFIMPDAVVISNTAVTDGGGGSVHFDDGSLVDLRRGHFERNRAGGSGGGLYTPFFDEGSDLFLDETRFISNSAVLGSGGGAYVDFPSELGRLAFSHAQIISNTAGEDGGGVYFSSGLYGSRVDFTHNLVQANRAGMDGGGVYLPYTSEGVVKHIDDNQFLDNQALTGSGGGVFQSSDFVGNGAFGAFNRNILRRNRAYQDGGGIHFSGSFTYDGSQASFEDNLIQENIAWNGQGGGVYMNDLANYGSTASFNRNQVLDNRSQNGGGGIYMSDIADSSIAQVISNTVTGNIVWGDGDGGGWRIGELAYYGSQAVFQYNIVSSNVISGAYGNGGGLRLTGLGDGDIAWMLDNQFNDNIAPDRGGGLNWNDDVPYGSTLYFERNQMNNNRAGRGGGCYFGYVFREGAYVAFRDNQANNNRAGDDYGGCYIDGVEEKTVDMTGNQFNDNQAVNNYAGLYFRVIREGGDLRFLENEIIGNQTGISGTQVISGGVGGGLWFDAIQSGSSVLLADNTIQDNLARLTTVVTTTVGGDYGGLYANLYDGGLLRLEGNTIAANQAEGSFGGAYIRLVSAVRLEMEANLIQANQAAVSHAGLSIAGGGDSQYDLARNRIIDNQAPWIGGLWIENSDAINPLWGRSENNLIAANSAPGLGLVAPLAGVAPFHSTNDTIADNGAAGIWLTGTQAAEVWLYNAILWGQGASFTSTHPLTQTLSAQYSDVQGGVLPGAGNISSDPLFVGGGDYHLTQSSPASDQVPVALAPSIDLAGIPRPVPVGGMADMGAYEWFQAGADLQSGQSVVALPGEIVTFSLTLTNQGNLADTFALDLPINTLGWNVSLQPAQVGLAAGESAAIQVLVEVPAAALGGLVADLTVRAVSAVDPAIIAVAALQVEVADVAGLALTPDNSASAQPGETLVFHHTLSNAGNFTDTVSLSASSDQGWTVLVQPASAPIPLGASIPVTVTVNVPEGAQAGILDSTTLTAQSSAANGATSATAQDQTTVLHVPGLSLGPDHTAGALEGTQVVYEHRLENTGNGPDTFNLSLSSSQGWAAALEANSVALAAGEAVTVAVTLDIPAGAAGLVDLTTLTAVSTADGSLSASAADATAAQAPQPPGAVLSLLPDNASLALPGETAVYTHTLTNLSSFTVTAVLGVASGQGWPAWVQPAALLLAPGASVVAEVSVWVPESAAAGTVDETILTAAAQDAAATVTDTTTVDETPVTAGGSLYLPFLAK